MGTIDISLIIGHRAAKSFSFRILFIQLILLTPTALFIPSGIYRLLPSLREPYFVDIQNGHRRAYIKVSITPMQKRNSCRGCQVLATKELTARAQVQKTHGYNPGKVHSRSIQENEVKRGGYETLWIPTTEHQSHPVFCRDLSLECRP